MLKKYLMSYLLKKVYFYIIDTIYLSWKTTRIIIGPSSCRFYPSCSNYFREALKRFGPFYGTILFIKRFLRCNPFHEPGYDPLPLRRK